MDISSFLLLFWLMIAFATLFNVAISGLIFSSHFQDSYQKIFNFIGKFFFLIPIIVIVVVAHLYYFLPIVRPPVDAINHQFMVMLDRGVYKLTNDSPTGRYTGAYVKMPLYPENYYLTIPNEVCANQIGADDILTDEFLNEKCKGIPWTPKIRSTYLLHMLYEDQTYFRYSTKQARALHNGQPIPPDEMYDNPYR